MEGIKAQTNEALISVKLAVDILTDCTVNERKWIFYPHAAPPSLLTDAFTQSSHSFPKGTAPIFPENNSSTNLLNKYHDLHLYIYI
jgi:hypothetical protein